MNNQLVGVCVWGLLTLEGRQSVSQRKNEEKCVDDFRLISDCFRGVHCRCQQRNFLFKWIWSDRYSVVVVVVVVVVCFQKRMHSACTLYVNCRQYYSHRLDIVLRRWITQRNGSSQPVDNSITTQFKWQTAIIVSWPFSDDFNPIDDI